MSLLANIGRLFLLRAGTQIGTLVVIMYFTRVLSPEMLGEYFYFESLLGITSIFAAFGIGGATEKFISEGENQDRWYSTGLGLLTLFSILTMMVFGVLQYFYSDLLRSEYLPLFFIALLSRQMVTYYRHIFRSEFRAAMGGVLDAFRNISFIIIAIILVQLDFGPLGVILGAIVGRIVVVPIASTKVKCSLTMPKIGKAVKLFHFAKYYFMTVVGSKFYQFADVVLIGLLMSKANVGRYDVAWRLILSGIMLNGVIAGTAFSYISQSSSIDDMHKVADILEESLKYALIIPLGFIGGAAVIGTDIIRALFTSAYVANNYLIIILSIGFLFQPFYFLFSRSLVAINQPRKSFYATVLGVLSNIILNIILIIQYGVIGAGMATTLSFAIVAGTYYYILQKYVYFIIPTERFLVQLTSAFVMGVFLWILKLHIDHTTTLWTATLFALGGILYIILLLIPETTRKDLIMLFRQVSS